MTLQITGTLLALVASADLSAAQYKAVKIDANGQVAVAGAGQLCVGILQDKPNAQGSMACVAPFLGTKLKALAGATVNKGDLLTPDATGRLVTASKAVVNTSDGGAASDPVIGSHVCGIALTAANVGEFVQFLGINLGAVPTTAV